MCRRQGLPASGRIGSREDHGSGRRCRRREVPARGEALPGLAGLRAGAGNLRCARGRPAVGVRATAASTHEVTAIVNTADDIRLHNLQICPDLDSCMYTLAGASDLQRGWGRADETWTVSGELAGYGAEAPWFSLGDKDIATHLMRTRMLDAGYPLSEVTGALCERWQPGRHAVADDRRPGRDPRRGRRIPSRRGATRPQRIGRAAADRPALPGVVDPLSGRAARTVDPADRRRGGQPRRRACSRRSPAPTWC